MPEVYHSKETEHEHSQKHRHVDEYSEIMRKEKPSRNYFKAFLPKPPKASFDTQASGENIVLLLRQHPITLLKNVVILIAALFLPALMGESFLTSFLTPPFLTAITMS